MAGHFAIHEARYARHQHVLRFGYPHVYMGSQPHHLPHLHVEYRGTEVVVSIPDGELIEGELPLKKLGILQAWIAIHEEELMADWALAAKGEPIFKIEPLR